MDFCRTQESHIGLGFASSDMTFLRPSKIHIGLPSTHHLYSDRDIVALRSKASGAPETTEHHTLFLIDDVIIY